MAPQVRQRAYLPVAATAGRDGVAASSSGPCVMGVATVHMDTRPHDTHGTKGLPAVRPAVHKPCNAWTKGTHHDLPSAHPRRAHGPRPDDLGAVVRGTPRCPAGHRRRHGAPNAPHRL